MSPSSHPTGSRDTTIDPLLADTTIHARFEQQADVFADRLAIHSAGRSVSYAQLNTAANRLAHEIVDTLGPGKQPVALLVEQGVPCVVAMLGALKAGHPFIPLDPTYPESRIRLMLDDASVDAVITNNANADTAMRFATKSVVLNLDQCQGRESNPGLDVDPTDLAYVLYTSGSTGKPKGVIQDHRSVIHNMLRHRLFLDITEDDRQSLLYPCSVYGGVRDTFNALLNGAGLYHYPIRDVGHVGLADWLERHQITIYCSVATVFRYFARELVGADLFPHLRMIKLGGEAPSPRDVELFEEHFNPGAVLFCGLGSTETGMSRRYPIARQAPLSGARVPLGHAVPDLDVQLLDEHGQPVEVGTIGEIVIRSRYITRGYWGRDDLNAQVLRPDPQDAESRIFFTGDLGVLDAEGCLVHKGRKDHQIKIRGNRVELQEIELALAECDNVQDAVVTGHINDRGDAQLVAYVVPRRRPAAAVSILRNSLKESLPHFMVPNLFVTLDELPLTPNGKVDRGALPEPDEEHTQTSRELDQPRDELERVLLELQKNVLNREHVSVTDSFFDVGGDSMLAVKMVLAIEEKLDRVVSLVSFYDTPSVRKLSNLLRKSAGSEQRSEVVALRETGDQPALFCLPGRGGTVFSFRRLVQLLSPHHPVYGLQYPGLADDTKPIADVKQLAEEMVRRILNVRPKGPYLLLGYSFGGLVAYEMAQLLLAAGHAVPYLAMLDTRAPGANIQRPISQRVELHWKRFMKTDMRGKLRYVTRRFDNVLVRLGRKKRAAEPPWQGLVDPESQGRVAEALSRTFEAAGIARDSYEPRPFSGSLHLFKSAAKPDWMEFVVVDEFYGWSSLVKNGIRTYEVPGEHLEMFDAAHAPMLAEQVRASLLSVETVA